MKPLPPTLYSAAQVRELDRRAIEQAGIPGLELMERAGKAVFEVLRERWPSAGRLAVMCGPGNNGGDGFVVARLAHQAGLRVTVFQVGDPERVRGTARQAREALLAAGLQPVPFHGQDLGSFEVIVDGLLGIGAEGDVTGLWRDTIAAINDSRVPVLAVDVPSGLHADTGKVLNTAVQSETTVTFIGLKAGLFTGAGPAHAGQVAFADLGVPLEVYAGVEAFAERFDYAALKARLLPRRRDGHKGLYGHVLVVGGERGMMGAARMAGEAAARVGAGLVSVATRANHAALLGIARPELMCHGIEFPAALAPLVERATVGAVGPGLGRSDWARGLLLGLIGGRLPLVLDADALNLLADVPVTAEDPVPRVLTPHPGEAARLLGVSVKEVQADRLRAARDIARRYGAVCVLKGSGTVVAGEAGPVAVCSGGNPGMASGGMGDVLTGVIAGLMAQEHAPRDAALLGVALHAEAGDRAAGAAGERGMLALDLMPLLRMLANPDGAGLSS